MTFYLNHNLQYVKKKNAVDIIQTPGARNYAHVKLAKGKEAKGIRIGSAKTSQLLPL